jgi:hypothetical protein
MRAPVHVTVCSPGTQTGIGCAVCGALIRRRQGCIRVTSPTAGGLITVLLHRRCHADLVAASSLPPAITPAQARAGR